MEPNTCEVSSLERRIRATYSGAPAVSVEVTDSLGGWFRPLLFFRRLGELEAIRKRNNSRSTRGIVLSS